MRFDLAVFYVVTSVAVFSGIAYGVENKCTSFGEHDMEELVMYVEGFDVDLRNQYEEEPVQFRLQTAFSPYLQGTPKGCGFYVRADGDRDGFASLHFPKTRQYRCSSSSDGTYLMRTTSNVHPVTYNGRLRLPSQSERAERVEVHADGHGITYLDIACVGVYDRKTGYRSVCVNNALLNDCAKRTDRWCNGYANRIPMSKSSSGVHKIVFRNFDFLVEGFQRLSRNVHDESARHAVCDSVDMVRGSSERYDEHCDAEHVGNGKRSSHLKQLVQMDPGNCFPVL